MADGCHLYYITDRSQFPGDESARRRALFRKIAEAATAGVDYIQLREKDLSTRELEALGREAVSVIREAQGPTTSDQRPATGLLINARTDIALAVGADGVHLAGDDILPTEVRRIWSQSGAGGERPVISVACHSADDVKRSETESADLAIFAPVFEKRDRPGTAPAGLNALREVCQSHIPVLALGGVTLENAPDSLAAGAAGIAGIRLFQENRIENVVRAVRRM